MNNRARLDVAFMLAVVRMLAELVRYKTGKDMSRYVEEVESERDAAILAAANIIPPNLLALHVNLFEMKRLFEETTRYFIKANAAKRQYRRERDAANKRAAQYLEMKQKFERAQAQAEADARTLARAIEDYFFVRSKILSGGGYALAKGTPDPLVVNAARLEKAAREYLDANGAGDTP